MIEKVRSSLPAAIAIVLGLSCWYFPAFDPDLGWQLIGGALVNKGTIPSTDPINTFNPFWHDYHWLGQLAIYKVYAAGGFIGLQFALGLLMALLALILLEIAKESGDAAGLAPVAALLLCFSLVESVTSIRPQMLALLLVALAQKRLLGPYQAREIPYLLALAILAANIHVYWIFIPILWFFYRCLFGSVAKRVAYGNLIALSSAGFVSPYTFIPLVGDKPFVFVNYALLWDYMQMPAALRSVIGEMRPGLAADGLAPYALVLSLLLVARYAKPGWMRDKGPQLFAAALTTALALRSLKFLAVFGVLAAPLISAAISEMLAKTRVAITSSHPALLLMALLFVGARAAYNFPPNQPWSRDMTELPIKACLSLRDLRPASGRSEFRIMTHFNHGGWCRWALFQDRQESNFRVTTDGRTQWVPPQYFTRSFEAYNVKIGWDQTIADWKPDAILVGKTWSLAQVLSRLPANWEISYQDDYFLVFLPKR